MSNTMLTNRREKRNFGGTPKRLVDWGVRKQGGVLPTILFKYIEEASDAPSFAASKEGCLQLCSKANEIGSFHISILASTEASQYQIWSIVLRKVQSRIRQIPQVTQPEGDPRLTRKEGHNDNWGKNAKLHNPHFRKDPDSRSAVDLKKRMQGRNNSVLPMWTPGSSRQGRPLR